MTSNPPASFTDVRSAQDLEGIAFSFEWWRNEERLRRRLGWREVYQVYSEDDGVECFANGHVGRDWLVLRLSPRETSRLVCADILTLHFAD